MKGLYKISAATPRLHLGDTAANVEEMARLARKAAESGVAAIVFPELSVTGYTCGDVFFRGEFLDAAEKALIDFDIVPEDEVDAMIKNMEDSVCSLSSVF